MTIDARLALKDTTGAIHTCRKNVAKRQVSKECGEIAAGYG